MELTAGFDCITDPCSIVWLIRDNRDLLNSVSGGRCESGLLFEDLDATGPEYADCKVNERIFVDSNNE